MDYRKKNSQTLIILSALAIYLSFIKSISSIRATLIFVYCIILLLNISSYFIKNKYYTLFSRYTSLILASFTALFDSFPINAFLYGSAVSAILSPKSKERIIYICCSISAFFIPAIITNINTNKVYDSLHTIMINIFPFVTVLLLITILRLRTNSKIAVRILNEELTIQNKKLQEYANQLEDITILNERNRVAQELHDSLGHYLMAISMHLDIFDKVKSSPDKSKEVLAKAKSLTSDSIKELRKTVFELTELKKSNILSETIIDLANNLSTLDQINFKTNIDSNIETFSPFIKDIIYKIVKESITNGLKHGSAKNFEINIDINKNKEIIFSIKNDGVPPNKLIKSNGLKGIEQRLSLIRGNAQFISKNGFSVYCTIPIRKEDTND